MSDRAGLAWEVRVGAQRAEVVDSVDLAQLYQAHRLALVRLAILLVDDLPTAEDVVQDAFGKLHARWRRLRDPNAALGYLRVAVVNGCRSVLRRRRTARLFIPPAPAPEPGADAVALLAEEHREVLAGLNRLPRRQREVLVLRYWSDMSELEVAEALGISRGTVKSTTSRALAALGTMLDTEGNR
ncbi:MAG TPA: SigE family RNA polymerase sigma factor [Rugosimonospora sp.]|nr:SigE family RNA polymerase sigma factor [Rugosimonospora sp.]